ncbi:MAG: PAS domain-containing protein [Methylacidiphilales bacterium]|nr:PAS domain-containing protein [Candidatus Methylacidiphilales bacterium]
MGYNNFRSPSQKQVNWLYALWIPLILPIVFFFIDDYYITSAFTTPLFLFLLISYLAFRLPPSIVAFWAGLYALTMFIVLSINVKIAYTAPYMMPYMRTAGFIVAGMVATLLASHRSRLEKGHQALFSIISSLPSAVIVSDISGNILLLNHEAEKILQGHINELTGLSFFSTFLDPDEQGQTIARYVSYFDARHTTPVPLSLHLREEPSFILHATLNVVRFDKNQYAVTVINRIESATKITAQREIIQPTTT